MVDAKQKNEICARCGGDVNLIETDDPCRCDKPVPTTDNAIIKILDALTNDRDAYRTLLNDLVGRDVSEDVARWKSSTEAKVDFLKEIEVPGRQFDDSMRVLEVVVTDVDGQPHFHDPASGIKWWMAQFGVSNANPGALQNLERAVYRPSSMPDRELVIKDRHGPTDWIDRPDDCSCNIVPANDELVAAGAKGKLYTERYVEKMVPGCREAVRDIKDTFAMVADAITDIPLELTSLDAFYVTMRAITAALSLRRKMATFDKTHFDHEFRHYMAYMLEHGTVYGLDMGWEPDSMVYKVSIKPTPVPESWDVLLYMAEDDLEKFAVVRYKNSAGVCQDYAPVQFLVRFVDPDATDASDGSDGPGKSLIDVFTEELGKEDDDE